MAFYVCEYRFYVSKPFPFLIAQLIQLCISTKNYFSALICKTSPWLDLSAVENFLFRLHLHYPLKVVPDCHNHRGKKEPKKQPLRHLMEKLMQNHIKCGNTSCHIPTRKHIFCRITRSAWVYLLRRKSGANYAFLKHVPVYLGSQGIWNQYLILCFKSGFLALLMA